VTASSSGTTVPCALAHAAGADLASSCWATHTGVQFGTGYTEAQIVAGQSTLTHEVGDITITTPGTVINNEWITGCISIYANNVTIENSLITSQGDRCQGGDNNAAGSALNNGNASTATPTGTLLKNITVDANDPGNQSEGDYGGVTLGGGTCDHCFVFGFAKDFLLNGSASNPTRVVDSYSPNLAYDWAACANTCSSPHMENIFMESSAYVTVDHSYMLAADAPYDTTAAIDAGATWGPTDHDTITNTYAEGESGVDIEGSCAATNNTWTHNALSNNAKFASNSAGVDYYNTNAGDVWSGNYVPETGAVLADPSPNSCA
jgi:uncharacterized Zn-binding protein involved in type VI secretion